MNDEKPDSIQPQTQPTEWFPGQNWLLKNWGRVRLGHEGVMLDRVDRNQRCVEVLARNAMTGDMQDTKGWPTEEGDMGVNIGDHDHVHHHYMEQTESKPSQKSGLLPKLLLISEATMFGSSLPFALPAIVKLFQKPPVVQPAIEPGGSGVIGIGTIKDLKE